MVIEGNKLYFWIEFDEYSKPRKTARYCIDCKRIEIAVIEETTFKSVDDRYGKTVFFKDVQRYGIQPTSVWSDFYKIACKDGMPKKPSQIGRGLLKHNKNFF
ncbi:hypothetical protein LCGC14_1629980 [marine sediment metagenome]|uniref:Uncharacterized protein n=1 Tax=marine sediment metagenome TaxID=412755 RepID=A0A0F9IPZ9_9ZZZZ